MLFPLRPQPSVECNQRLHSQPGLIRVERAGALCPKCKYSPSAWEPPEDSISRAAHCYLVSVARSYGTQGWVPRRWPGGRGNKAEALGLGNPTPTAITGNERTGKTNQKAVLVSSTQVSFPNTTFLIPSLSRSP